MSKKGGGTLCRVVVLASGRGSNLQALLDASAEADFPARVAAVLSDKRDAPALDRARSAGVAAEWIDPAAPGYEARLGDAVEKAGADLICCAGYMRILGEEFIHRFEGRLLNIHPSLLPSFPGLDAQRKALRAGVRISGCTVHFIDEGVDTGPIILQAAVPVLPGDDEKNLSDRILVQEHRLYPLVVRLWAEGKIAREGRKVRFKEGAFEEAASAISSPCRAIV
ncbi:MAG: phosphoribosylglycinamide formyltransferase [bacterium]|nr:phosphoribosylglycinamide formyltransferase [bacterium]